MLAVIRGTPIWVWILFAYLLMRGFKATKTRTVLFPKIFVLPAIFATWSLTRLCSQYDLDILYIESYSIAILLGSWISWTLSKKIQIKINRSEKTITIPGTWTTLLLILAVFAVKYSFGCLNAVYPNLRKEFIYFCITEIVISGMVTGILLGKVLYYFYRYQQARLNMKVSRNL